MSDPIKLTEGHSYTTVIRLETDPIVRKAITSITAPNGCALIHVPSHGVKDGWRVAVTNAKGMPKINADLEALANPEDPENANQYHQATVVDADHIELNRLNIVDFGTHTANTGFIQYNTPAVLTGNTYRTRVRDKKGGKLLVCISAGTSGTTKPTMAMADGTCLWAVGAPAGDEKVWTANTVYEVGDVIDLSIIASSLAEDAPLNVIAITPNETTSTIKLTFSVAASILMAGKTGYFDIEEVTADDPPQVRAIVSSSIIVEME